MNTQLSVTECEDRKRDPPRSHPNTSVGSTVAARMQSIDTRSTYPKISVEKCVLDATAKVCAGVEGLIPSTRLIVESLVWCFVARRSMRDELFTDIEYGRFISSMRDATERIVSHQTPDVREQSYVKYWTDSYLAMCFLDSERPVRGDWNTSELFSGWCKKAVMRALAHRDISFIYSLQKGAKQMWAPLSKENLRQSIKKSMARLCEPRGSVPESIARTIESTARSIFRNTGDGDKRFMPSASACIQSSIAEGGSLGMYLPMDADREGYILKNGSRLGRLPSLVHRVDEWRQATFDDSVSRFVDELRLEAHTESEMKIFDTKAVFIYEPGKIRGISISDGNLATLLQPLQGAMLSAWKNQVWSTMREDDLTESVRRMDKEVEEEYWVSGDYEAATDLLLRDATRSCFSALSWHPLSEIAWWSLNSGSMIYPNLETLKFMRDAKDGSEEFCGTRLPIQEGQLMGHTLSFPMLCVINLSVLKHAVKEWCQSTPLYTEQCARVARGRKIVRFAKVNGDDILFKAPLDLIAIFKSIASKVGFKTSQGKNYVSPDTCLINSQVFIRKDGVMQRRGYLNLRLVKGNNIKARKAAGESMVTPEMIGRDLSKMAKLCPWSASAIPAAFRRWEDDWKGCWFQPNWYLPVHLGGYGVDIDLAPENFEITRAQRVMASRFVADPELMLYRMNSSVKLRATGMQSALLKPRMIAGDYVPQEHEISFSESEDSWMGRISYAARASAKPEEFTTRNDPKVFMQVLKPEHRLSPISAEGLCRYWRAQLFVVGAPACPPIGRIRFTNVPKFGHLFNQPSGDYSETFRSHCGYGGDIYG